MVIRDERMRSELTEHGQARIVQVPGTTLDALLGEHRIDPDRVGLVWADTQGHEAHVLKGASHVLRHPVPMLIEFLPACSATPSKTCRTWLSSTSRTWWASAGPSAPTFQPVASTPQITEAYLERPGTFTDLLLVNL